jgi:hypothetical protein
MNNEMVDSRFVINRIRLFLNLQNLMIAKIKYFLDLLIMIRGLNCWLICLLHFPAPMALSWANTKNEEHE